MITKTKIIAVCVRRGVRGPPRPKGKEEEEEEEMVVDRQFIGYGLRRLGETLKMRDWKVWD